MEREGYNGFIQSRAVSADQVDLAQLLSGREGKIALISVKTFRRRANSISHLRLFIRRAAGAAAQPSRLLADYRRTGRERF